VLLERKGTTDLLFFVSQKSHRSQKEDAGNKEKADSLFGAFGVFRPRPFVIALVHSSKQARFGPTRGILADGRSSSPCPLCVGLSFSIGANQIDGPTASALDEEAADG